MTIISSFLQLLFSPRLKKRHGKVKTKALTHFSKIEGGLVLSFEHSHPVYTCTYTYTSREKGEGNVVLRVPLSFWHPRWRRHNKQNSLRWKRFSVWQGACLPLSLSPCWINLIARGCGRPFEEWPYDRLTLTVITPWIIQVLPLISGRG